MIYTNCPKCGALLCSDCWVEGRMLQQRCGECGWRGKPRIPETQELKTTKKVMAGQFFGFHYEIFDKYNHTMTMSRYYNTKKEAIKEMTDDLARGNKRSDVAPCTGILWPDKVTVKGKLFKLI